MQDIIIKATENFVVESLGLSLFREEKFVLASSYGVSISLDTSTKKSQFYLFLEEELLRSISKVLFMDENPDDETKIDLLCECANLIVGNAKVLISQSRGISDIELGIPQYQGYNSSQIKRDFNEDIYLNIDGKKMMIGIEKIAEVEVETV